MLSKRTKKLWSKCMRKHVMHKDWIVETDNEGLRDKWRVCRDRYDNDSWFRYTIIDCHSFKEATDYAHSLYEVAIQALPDYDCSGKPFIRWFHVAPTNMPGWYVIVQHWTIDV